MEDLMTKPNKEVALKIASPYSLGYAQSCTVENMLKEVGARICSHHGWEYNEAEVLETMKDQNVINAGGLDNFVYTFYTRLQVRKSK